MVLTASCTFFRFPGAQFESSSEVGVFAKLTNAYCLTAIGTSENFYRYGRRIMSVCIPVTIETCFHGFNWPAWLVGSAVNSKVYTRYRLHRLCGALAMLRHCRTEITKVCCYHTLFFLHSLFCAAYSRPSYPISRSWRRPSQGRDWSAACAQVRILSNEETKFNRVVIPSSRALRRPVVVCVRLRWMLHIRRLRLLN